MFNKIFIEENAQSSAELILLIGGILIILIAFLDFYKKYINDIPSNVNSKELYDFNNSINHLSDKFNKFV
ncbi:class III signal peptide-containing protein [Methanobrevibacter wolinii]|uniref:class III signal peptide-containing protein n=1 Tax=Methanobrevibacter wolinii TaxID=190977 RepID=UPI0005B28127|nr:class III signal peptide-containing protein [Methanobrevibacter wolinii]